ncbi:MAG: phosphoribosylformylglycinamidine cyclo-ligase [Pseudomonadota bacterium]
MNDQYKKAGVDIDAGNHFVDLIKPFVQRTQRRGVLTGIGGYGGLFALDTKEYKEPVLVSSTDGVGTKLKIAIELNKYDTIGQDLVAMCVNDIACCGAKPLFFLDYFATGQLKPEEHQHIVKGIAKACETTHCALIGGETAEMPDMYTGNDFDLAGFAVGIVDRHHIIDGTEVRLDNSIIGIASSGFHSNGYSLVRKIIKDHNLDLHKPLPGMNKTLGELVLEPTILYSPITTRLIREFKINAIAHITGGGFVDNIPRVLPPGVKACIDKQAWQMPAVMKHFEQIANLDEAEMFRVFNCGIGLILVLPSNQVKDVCDLISAHGESAYEIGSIKAKKANEPVVELI